MGVFKKKKSLAWGRLGFRGVRRRGGSLTSAAFGDSFDVRRGAAALHTQSAFSGRQKRGLHVELPMDERALPMLPSPPKHPFILLLSPSEEQSL